MKFKFGDIVLLHFPFTDTLRKKKRPALILFDTDDEDIIVARVTSKLHNTNFDLQIDNWESYGLKLPSVVRLHKVATLDKSIVDKIIGRLDNDQKNKIIYKVKELIENWL
jgi:mRNA interferase MazF